MFNKNGVSWSGINEEWKERLSDKPWSRFFKGNPFIAFQDEEAFNMLNLRTKILDYAGDDVCLPFGFSDLSIFGFTLLKHAEPFNADNILVAEILPVGSCHHNAAYVAELHPDKVELCYGFYMDSEGMWREHSWLVDKDNRIIETTNQGTAYFGVNLTAQDEELFFIDSYLMDSHRMERDHFCDEINKLIESL